MAIPRGFRTRMIDRLQSLTGMIVCAVLLLGLLIAASPSAEAQSRGERRDASWWRRAPADNSRHYFIKTDLPIDEARAYAKHLDAMYREYARRLADLPPRAPEKLNVYLFAKKSDYIQTMREQFGVDATGSGGMFFVQPTGSGLAIWTEGLPERRIHHVIQHEGFHQFAFSRFGADLPIWANEGLAEFFGESVLVGNRLIIGQSTPRVIESIKQAIADESYIRFHDMLTMTDEQWLQRVSAGDAALQYHQAWSMVHFLVYGDGGRYRRPFEAYLRLLNEGVESEQAFIRIFGRDLDAFEARWKAHMAEAVPSAFLTAMERIEFLAEGALWLSREKQAPETMDALRAALEAADFTHTVEHHGHQNELEADDPSVYEIPEDEHTTQRPGFEIGKPDADLGTHRSRMFEEQWPTPPSIRTKHLEPRDLVVEWKRDTETGDVSYVIRAK